MTFSGRNGETLSQINVTPLVDVMLVLLVIFMVTAPILQQGVRVDLPKVGAPALAGEEVQLVVSLTVQGRIYLNDTAMSAPELGAKLRAILREQRDPQVFLHADAAVRYGEVMQVMASIREAGVRRLAMVTAPRVKR